MVKGDFSLLASERPKGLNPGGAVADLASVLALAKMEKLKAFVLLEFCLCPIKSSWSRPS
jgi:hypothetical protein